MFLRAATVIAVLLAQTPGLAAQGQTSQVVGQRIRVTYRCQHEYLAVSREIGTHCKRETGAVATVGADSIIMTLAGSRERLAVAHESIAKIELSSGQRPKSMIIGAVVGAALGALSSAGCEGLGCVTSPAQGFAGGAVIGLGIGWLFSSERWREIPPDGLRVTPTVSGGAIVLVGSLRF